MITTNKKRYYCVSNIFFWRDLTIWSDSEDEFVTNDETDKFKNRRDTHPCCTVLHCLQCIYHILMFFIFFSREENFEQFFAFRSLLNEFTDLKIWGCLLLIVSHACTKYHQNQSLLWTLSVFEGGGVNGHFRNSFLIIPNSFSIFHKYWLLHFYFQKSSQFIHSSALLQ